MMNLAKTKFILFLFLCSCSTYINFIEDDQNIKFKEKVEATHSCEKPKDDVFIGKNKEANLNFQNFITKISKNKQFSFIEKGILWSLYQIKINPIKATPSSRLQLVVFQNSTIETFDFNNLLDHLKHLENPYTTGLSYLLKKSNSKLSLADLAKLIDKHLKARTLITPQISSIISKYKEAMNNDPYLRKYYFKGDSILMPGESIPQFDISSILKKTSKKKLLKNKALPLFKYNIQNSDYQTFCNMDLSIYQSKIYLTHTQDYNPPHVFAMTNKKGHIFLGISNLLEQARSWKKGPLYSGKNPTNIGSFCFMKHIKNNSTLLISSIRSRDPGQILFNLLNYNLIKGPNPNELKMILKFPRHQMIPNPPRMLLETKRTRKEQLSEFLTYNIPIYHQRKLGEIWLFWNSIEAHNQWGFSLDDRNENYSTCTNS